MRALLLWVAGRRTHVCSYIIYTLFFASNICLCRCSLSLFAPFWPRSRMRVGATLISIRFELCPRFIIIAVDMYIHNLCPYACACLSIVWLYDQHTDWRNATRCVVIENGARNRNNRQWNILAVTIEKNKKRWIDREDTHFFYQQIASIVYGRKQMAISSNMWALEVELVCWSSKAQSSPWIQFHQSNLKRVFLPRWS